MIKDSKKKTWDFFWQIEKYMPNKKPLANAKGFLFGRGRRTRTLTGGFGDRCATIDTIPLNLDYLIILAYI